MTKAWKNIYILFILYYVVDCGAKSCRRVAYSAP